MKKGNQFMDNRLKTKMDKYDGMVVGLDDTVRFHSKMCGKCCTHREDIVLNPKDIYQIAKALNKEPAEIVTEYCDTYLGQTSRMVIVRLLPQCSVECCPFLKDRKCSIRKSKLSCGDTSETHSGRAWLSEFGLPEDKEFFKRWMKLVKDIGMTIRDVESVCSGRVVDDIAVSVLACIYLNYSIDESFLPQFLENDKKYRETMSKVFLELGFPNRLNA